MNNDTWTETPPDAPGWYCFKAGAPKTETRYVVYWCGSCILNEMGCAEPVTLDSFLDPMFGPAIPSAEELAAMRECVERLENLMRNTPFTPHADGIQLVISMTQVAAIQGALTALDAARESK